MKKILAVFAHPDDEAFGPGGTLAKYGATGVLIHLLCTTRGERGQKQFSKSNLQFSNNKEVKISEVREKELLRSAEILGIKQVEFLDFIDGRLSNSIYHDLADKIIDKIENYKPQIIITNERRGISGHLDHIAVSMVTTYSYLRTNAAKLYYYCLSEKQRRKEADDYFVYFPEGYPESEITTRIDYLKYFDIKKSAMYQHQSQLKDVEAILSHITLLPKIDNFILQYSRGVKIILPETDLFAGL